MKNFCYPNSFKHLLTYIAVIFIVSSLSGCNAINAFAEKRSNQNSAIVISPSDDLNRIPVTSSAQTQAQCQNILRGDRRNKPNDRGELPADMPVPRGSVLCGYVDGQRATYYINDAVDKTALAQFYRDALPAQGFDLQMDNPSEGGGKFMVFGRGASESVQIQTTLSSLAEFRNMFSIAYMPPRNQNGEELTGTTIMRGAGNSNRDGSTTNAQKENSSQTPSNCGGNPLGSVKCAIELQKDLRDWQFSLEDTARDGRRKTYTGEFLKRDHQVRIHFALTGRGRDDGEWWFRMGNNPLVAGDNGSRAYRKESGRWVRYETTPDDVGGIVLTETSAIGELDGSSNVALVATENVNGEECNHFRRTIPGSGEFNPQVNLDYWISTRTGYCLRRRSETGGNVRLLNVSQQNEINTIESPQSEG